MSKRFKSTSATKDAQFMLSKLDDGVGLIKINKDPGKPVKEIILNDKKTEYEVDEWGGFLYYKASGGTVNAYDLKQ